MENRIWKHYNILIGKNKYNEFIFLDEAFKYQYWFKWLVWTKYMFHTEEEAEKELTDYLNNDWVLELWKEAVAWWHTYSSYSDYVDDFEWDYSIIYDQSGIYDNHVIDAIEIASEKDWIDYDRDYSSCVWWWRIFDEEEINEEYYEWIIEENFNILKNLYKEYEEKVEEVK